MIAILLLLSLVSISKCSNPVTMYGYDYHNTRNFKSDINKYNVGNLTLKWEVNLCDTATSTPLVIGGRVCISDFGGCYSCYKESNGELIFRKNLASDYGFPSGVFSRITPTYSEGVVILGTCIHQIQPPPINYTGATVFAVDINGDLIWKTTVSDNPWSEITQSPIIKDDYIYIGTSSIESGAPLIEPGYDCCTFCSSMNKIDLFTGEIEWKNYPIPPEFCSNGYSGTAIWNTMSLVSNYIYYGTGELYAVPQSVIDCYTLNPHNASCVDRSILFDSVIKVDIRDGSTVASFRGSAADVFNIICFFGGSIPGCQLLEIAFDFDITSVMYSKNNNLVIATSKSGFLWILDDNLMLRNYSSGPSSASGGTTWAGALHDNEDLDKLGIYIPNNNGNGMNVTLSNGIVVTSGVFIKLNGYGEAQWIVGTPFGDGAYASTSVTGKDDDCIMVGSSYQKGLILILDCDNGNELWRYQTDGAMTGVAAITGKNLIYSPGPGTRFFPTILNSVTLRLFSL